ncbi:MAG: ferritin-like domain-containing protein, partial [Acidimicrobiales bacterium]
MSTTEEMSSNEALIGRADVNDLEAILAVSNTDRNEVIHAVEDNADAIFTWDYAKGQRPALNRLYEKAKTSQWNGETDLDWSIDVDQEAVVAANAAQNGFMEQSLDLSGTQMEHWSDEKWLEFGVESNNWLLS